MLKLQKTLLLSFVLIFVSLQKLAASDKTFAPIEERIKFSPAYWGICITDSNTQEVLYSHNASKLFIPASLTKLFTTAVALEILKPDYVFKTTVFTSGPIGDNGTVLGNLYLKGTGDPTLKNCHLEALAKKIYDQGIRHISGSLIADDSLFQGSSLPTHGEWEDFVEAYAPEQCALSVNENIVKAIISPNNFLQGDFIVSIEQDVEYCQLINRITTSSQATQPNLTVKRGLTNNIIEITGDIPPKHHTITLDIAIHNPAEYARRIFLKCLIKLGITFGEQASKNNQNTFYEVAWVSSAPLSSLITKLNKESHNLTADLIFRAIGTSGNFLSLNAIAQARHLSTNFLKQLSIKEEEYQIHDGSGLSRHNLISPQQVVSLLNFTKNSSIYQIFIDSLPLAGIEGNLSKRFVNPEQKFNMKAKTGRMSGISNLAGFATTPRGRQVSFAIFINHSPKTQAETTADLDSVIFELLNFL